MHRDWSARLISVTWPEAVRPSTFWRRLSALFLFILSKRLPDCPWRLVESWAQSSNLSCCRFGPQTSPSSREPPCCPGRKWRGFLSLPITNLKGFAEFRLHCADERLKLMEMVFKVRWKGKVLPTLCSVPFFSASKCRKLSRGELAAKAVLSSHEAALWCLCTGQGWVKTASWAFFCVSKV